MINLLLVEDHEVVRNGLRLLLDSQKEMTVVGEVGSAEDAIAFLEHNCEPDLILTDIQMGEMDGIELIRIVKSMFSDLRIAVLSMIEDLSTVAGAFKAGADGYLIKSADYKELIYAIEEISQGRKYLASGLGIDLLNYYVQYAKEPIDRATLLHRFGLSERELTVLELIAQGHTNAEIAEQVFLSKRTVEGHRQSLIEKTKTRNTAELVRFGFQNGLLN